MSLPSEAAERQHADYSRKYEHSKTFGLIASANSNAIWCRNDNTDSGGAPSSNAGRAVVGAAEEVLCWDVKRGELLSRWKDSACNAQVTAIARSKADLDIYAVGYAINCSETPKLN